MFYLNSLLLFHFAFFYMIESSNCHMMNCSVFASNCHQHCRRLENPLLVQAIVIMIKEHLYSASHLRCWNHIFRDSRRWLGSHGANTNGISVYLADMKVLFHISSSDEYNSALADFARKWSAPFHQYYMTCIHPDIESIARWGIEPCGVYNPFSGVTTNQAEGL